MVACRTKRLVLLICAASCACTMRSINSWVGPIRVGLTFFVVDGQTDKPITDAQVELFHPYDPDAAAQTGETDPRGLVTLTARFLQAGNDSVKPPVHMVFYSPWSLRVTSRSKSYKDFYAHLSEEDSTGAPCSPPPDFGRDGTIRIGFPPPRRVTIRMIPLGSNSGVGH